MSRKLNDAMTIGQKIDAVLGPFVEDESRLDDRLADLDRQLEALQAERAQAQEDLSFIRTAKINALRDAAADDPLLQAAFGPAIAEAEAAEAAASAESSIDHDGRASGSDDEAEDDGEAASPSHRLLVVDDDD